MYDSRLLHCGGANRSFCPRVLFYFSVSNPLADDQRSFDDPEGELQLDDAGFERSASIRKESVGFTLGDFRKN